ncbi:hypothetical protein L2649_01000 [Thermoactinomyces vulgaris]|nr:hypothetical protein [Thermoactinomyces vulgaris]MCF6133759.1 hypothetical protein [Thermoactinomyces vulgaris]
MKTIHHGKLFLCFILVACVLATPTAYATGGGSFDVPQIHEDFNQGKPAPAPKPTEELNVAPSKQEKGFFSQVGDCVSGSWNKLKNGVSNTWNNLKNGAKKTWDTAASATKKAAQKAWDWMTSTAGKITGGIVLGITALTGLLSKFGQPLARGIQSAYTNLKNLFARKGLEGQNLTASLGNAGMAAGNSQYPHGKLSDIDVSDKQLAELSELAYDDEINYDDLRNILGENWKVSKKIDKDNGLQGYIFTNKFTQEMVIAFRGTEPTNDFINDVFIADYKYIAHGDDRNNPQAVEARKIVADIINSEEYKGYKMVLTGHSLGGYLAVDCAARYDIPAVSFNAPGMNLEKNLNISTVKEFLRAFAFFPKYLVQSIYDREIKFGVYNSYKRNITDPKIREIAEKERSGAYDEMIRNYRYNDDLIGSFGYRPGKTYNIQPDGSIEEADDKDGLDQQLTSKFGHKIGNFTDSSKSPIPKIYDQDGNLVSRKRSAN